MTISSRTTRHKYRDDEHYNKLAKLRELPKEKKSRRVRKKINELQLKLMWKGGGDYDIVRICLQLLDLGLLYMTRRRHGVAKKLRAQGGRKRKRR